MSDYMEAEAFLEYDGSTSAYYDAVRRVLKPEYSSLTDEQIASLLRPMLAQMSPEELEGFWDTVKSIGSGVVSVAKDVGSGAVSVAKTVAPVLLPAAGAALGTYLAPGIGTQIGATLGQMGSQLIGGSPPSAPVAAGSIPTGLPPAAAAAPLPTGGNSALQLMSFIQNPAFLQSLMQQVLGGAGRQSVPVGSQHTAVPVGAFMNALSSLASLAAAEAEFGGSDTEALAYLRDEQGNFAADPANPDQRAQRLLALLREPAPAATLGVPRFDPITEWMLEANLVAA